MVTLLLTFFVMLLSMANVQDPEIYNKSRDAFVEYINNYGLGMLSGKKMATDLAVSKQKHKINNPDGQEDTRVIDANRERLNNIFNKMMGSVTTMPPQIVGETIDFAVAKVNFMPGSSKLDGSAKKFIAKFAANLQQNTEANTIKLYVLGLSQEKQSPRNQWILSAQRAEAVANLLQNTFPADLNWPVLSWGAGPGNSWSGADSPIAQGAQILIVVLRNQS